VEHVTLDLGAVSLSPMLEVEFTLKNQNKTKTKQNKKTHKDNNNNKNLVAFPKDLKEELPSRDVCHLLA